MFGDSIDSPGHSGTHNLFILLLYYPWNVCPCLHDLSWDSSTFFLSIISLTQAKFAHIIAAYSIQKNLVTWPHMGERKAGNGD